MVPLGVLYCESDYRSPPNMILLAVMSLLGYIWIWHLLDSSQISLITQQNVEYGTTPCCQSSPGGWKTSAHRPYCQNKERTINQRWHWLYFTFSMEYNMLILGSFLRSAGSSCQRSNSWAGLWNTPGLVRGMPLITACNSYGIILKLLLGSPTTLWCDSMVSLHPRCNVSQWRFLLWLPHWCWWWYPHLYRRGNYYYQNVSIVSRE